MTKRVRVRVKGRVQGVGFRPYVHGLAHSLDLSGFVLNDAQGVLIEVEGGNSDQFVRHLVDGAPPLAQIDRVEFQEMEPLHQSGFRILTSASGLIATRIPADAATCPDCLQDLFNENSRFYEYPFVTCTHCGPRYTITRGLPYDRPQTALADFPLCPQCQQDYTELSSRRYHAESLACPVCGPRLSHSVDEMAAALADGQIVAVKGIGGYHLMCDASNEIAVASLRQRKNRDAKPFAVMVADVAAADSVAWMSVAEQELLTSRARPIVVLKSKQNLAQSVAPNLDRLGVVLAYSPLHHLLFQRLAKFQTVPVLVATSANPAGEPLVIDDQQAVLRLSGIADLIVSHDRPIVVRADDSVMAVQGHGPIFLRRARGFVPDTVDLGSDGPAVLAVGAHLKVTVTVTRGAEAFVSQHVGSMDNAATVDFFHESVRHLLALTGVTPECVVCDLHPDLLTTRFAQDFGVPVHQVQHHVAHVAAGVAEHGLSGPVLGVALDGYGYGADGTAWGGELIVLDGPHWQRVGHLAPLPMPGGDRAAQQPWRMAAAALHLLGKQDLRFAGLSGAADLVRLFPRLKMPQTTSLGRVFDAAAAMLGVCLVQHYEGQAAMELEALVRQPQVRDEGFAIKDGVLNLLPLLGILAELDPQRGADVFHGTLVAALTQWIAEAAQRRGLSTIVLGGGCVMNRVLADGVIGTLTKRGLRALVPSCLPAGDGGLSLGQAFMGRTLQCA